VIVSTGGIEHKEIVGQRRGREDRGEREGGGRREERGRREEGGGRREEGGGRREEGGERREEGGGRREGGRREGNRRMCIGRGGDEEKVEGRASLTKSLWRDLQDIPNEMKVGSLFMRFQIEWTISINIPA
jgi:ATP-dependent RNA helicase DHX57